MPQLGVARTHVLFFVHLTFEYAPPIGEHGGVTGSDLSPPPSLQRLWRSIALPVHLGHHSHLRLRSTPSTKWAVPRTPGQLQLRFGLMPREHLGSLD
jgi:hypothetical protein